MSLNIDCREKVGAKGGNKAERSSLYLEHLPVELYLKRFRTFQIAIISILIIFVIQLHLVRW